MPTKKKAAVAATKPAKKASKPVPAKPAAKKTIATKPAPKASKLPPKAPVKPTVKSAPGKTTAKAAKPLAKVATKPATKPAAKAVAKPVAKAVPAKQTPTKAVAKSAPAKAAAKPVSKAVAKPVPSKAVPAKAVPAKQVPAAKSAPVKTVAAKPLPVKAAPVKGAPAKPAPVEKKAPETKAAPAAPPVIRKVETPQSEVARNAARLAELRKAARAQEAKKVSKPVVLPKINSTSSRPYQPEFTKSVLDRPAQEQTGPTMRYSDAELAEFRELIQRKLEAAKKELAYLHGLITRKDEMSGDETDNRYMTMEDGSLSMEREQLSQMASRQIDFIDKLEKAMIRIENKSYGICRVTGKLIDKARLRAVPHATLSMEAKMGMARNPNMQ
jgi:RNA polymerase-binding transcription factor DksA